MAKKGFWDKAWEEWHKLPIWAMIITAPFFFVAWIICNFIWAVIVTILEIIFNYTIGLLLPDAVHDWIFGAKETIDNTKEVIDTAKDVKEFFSDDEDDESKKKTTKNK